MVEKTTEAMRPQRKIAMLVDGDNAQPKLIEKIIQETSRYGTITIKRIYGDWKQHLHEHAIQPIQQFRNTVGKNATDSALIIDAMDILHHGLVNGFAIISSDSDYTRLATRIREHGIFVMGIGERKTPDAFVKSCEIFVYTENLMRGDGPETPVERKIAKVTVEPSKAKNAKLIKLLIKAYNMAVLDDGWAHLSQIRESLSKIDPSFDPRDYGYRQMLPLFKDQESFFEFRGSGAGVYVRLKE
jgi:uncharacterized protein (TIGR00288 family)